MGFLVGLALLSAVVSVVQVNGQSAISSYFARDFYLNATVYPEGLPTPYYGGKWHLLFTVAKHNVNAFPAFKKPFTMTFANDLSITLTEDVVLPYSLDWIFCEYQQNTGQVWINLHQSNDDFFDSLALLRVIDADQQLMGSYKNINAPHSGLQLLYVTAVGEPGSQELVIHWYCYYEDVEFSIANMYFNGVLLDSNVPVGPLQHTVRTYPLPTTVNPGDIWTLNVVLFDGLKFGWGGRYKNSQQKYQMISVPTDAQCPYADPATNADNYQTLTTAMDMTSTLLTYDSTCSASPSDVLAYYNAHWNAPLTVNNNDLALTANLSNTSSALSAYSARANIVTALTVFNNRTAHNDFVPLDLNATQHNSTTVAHAVYRESLLRRLWYPQLMTIANTYTNHRVGVYAGITDYLVVQFNLALCALNPLHNALQAFPVTAPFEYYTNARLNNMPQSTYAMIQGFRAVGGGGAASNAVLNTAEITLGIGQALAAGLQGLVLDGTDLTQMTSNSDAWTAAASLMTSVEYLDVHKGYMSTMAMNGAPIVLDGGGGDAERTLWSALRSMNALVVIAVNTNCDEYEVSKCASAAFTGDYPHWQCTEITLNTVTIVVPPDWQQMRALKITTMELVAGIELAPEFEINLIANQTQLVFSGVSLSGQTTTRIFLLEI